MADKQALNATFFAFRKREKGGVLLGATIAYVVLAAVIIGAFAWLNWQGIAEYMNWAMTMNERMAGVDPQSPDAMQAMMAPASVMALGPAYLLLTLAIYILLAAYEAACLRWMIRGETGGVFGLSFGADTWRVYFGYWIWFFLTLAIYIVLVIAMLGMGVGVGAAAQGGGEAAGPMGLVMIVVGFVLLLAWLFIAVRLAPAAATSVARNKFAFFDAWKVTKGRFWGLLGAFVLLFVMYFVLCLVVGGVGGFLFASSAASQAAAIGDPQDASQVLSLFASPAVWIPLAVMYGVLIVASMVLYVAMFGINARAAALALEEGKITAA